MTDTTLTPNEPVPQEPKSINMREQIEREGEAGRAAAEGNAQQQDEARESRQKQTLNARDWAARAAAANDKSAADRAEEVKGMVDDLPPPGPGMPKVDKGAIMATMDPNNPVLNPDMSEVGRTRGLPPGAHTPAPVLPQDTVQTQYASKPPTDAHAQAGEEQSKSLDTFPPAGSQPTMTDEEVAERGGQQQQIGGPAAPLASPVAPQQRDVYTGTVQR